MKVSEAILKGCEGTRKIRGYLYDNDSPTSPKFCCVVGAAALGMRGNAADVMPIFEALGLTLYQECVRRNNQTNQSRQSIAKWLAKKGY